MAIFDHLALLIHGALGGTYQALHRGLLSFFVVMLVTYLLGTGFVHLVSRI